MQAVIVTVIVSVICPCHGYITDNKYTTDIYIGPFRQDNLLQATTNAFKDGILYAQSIRRFAVCAPPLFSSCRLWQS